MITDLTEGNVKKLLWRFTIPMFFSVVFQQMYSIADSVVAGRFAGKDALAAVGASYPITMIFIAIATGGSMGCSVVVSQLFGEKNFVRMRTAVNTALVSIAALGAVLTAAGTMICNLLIRLLNTPENIFADSSLYLKIYIWGLLFLFLYNIATGIFNALGDSRTPLYFLIASSVGNIILDVVFVKNFHMGVAGVAWATFAAQGAASLLAVAVLMKRLSDMREQTAGAAVFSGRMLKRIGIVAVPSILQQSFVSVGNLIVQIQVNGFGADVIAGYSAAIKLNTFTIVSVSTIGNAISSFTAQNIGAKRFDRIREGHKGGVVMGMAVSAVFLVLYFAFGAKMTGLFVSGEETKVIGVGETFLRIVSPFYVVVTVKLICDGVLRGAGAMKQFMVTTFSDLILRVLLSVLLTIPFGSTGIWLSWPVGWIVGSGLSWYYYRKGSWKKSLFDSP